MATLAIKGHATRGREVIELLKMLGGRNTFNERGNRDFECYFISNLGNICSDKEQALDGIKCFTLEQFLEKFPYKVGDKVNVCGENAALVIGMRLESDYIVYRVRLEKNGYETSKMVMELQPYTEQKEETMEEEKINQMSLVNCDLDKVEIVLGDKFEMVFISGKWYAIRKKPQYPKTYEECCEVMKIEYPYFKTEEDGISASTYKNELVGAFKKLLICRDAYWKIAGDWKPDWKNNDDCYFAIATTKGGIGLMSSIYIDNGILVFPTEEMRDAFYENFKELINECRELL